jgi:hypothetical protein
MPSLLRILALLTVAAPAAAANWVQVDRTSTAIVLIDTDSIVRRGAYMQAWFLWDYFEDQQTERSYPAKVYRSSKELRVFDCAARSTDSLQSVRFSGDTGQGDVVESLAWPVSQKDFRDVVPDSIGEEMLNRVCRKAPSLPGRSNPKPRQKPPG